MSDHELDPSMYPAATDPVRRTGASVADNDADDDLPLVVWLRGDEPYCSEFLLEADDVMQQLGIRRSRLTQISGKELRVGRIRRGRYVSPVYRQVDVDQYRSWTRATASHLKSSSVLNGAAMALQQQGEALAAQMADAPREIIAQLTSDARRNTATVVRQMHDAAQGWVQRLAVLADEMRAVEQRLGRRLGAQTSRLDELASNLDAARTLLPVVMQHVGEVAALVRTGHAEFSASLAALQAEQARMALLVEPLMQIEARPPTGPRPRRAAEVRRVRRLACRGQTALEPARPRRARPGAKSRR